MPELVAFGPGNVKGRNDPLMNTKVRVSSWIGSPLLHRKHYCSIASVCAQNHRSKPKLTRFARKLFEEWRRLGLSLEDAPVVVAVSGGADSTALLLALHELTNANKFRANLIVAHLDHGLRAASGDDAKWVAALAKKLGYPAVTTRANLKSNGKRQNNLEQAARNARYEFLVKVAKRRRSELVLTGHTLDDQAETILLRLIRGSAADGLAGMSPVREIEPASTVKLVRPLLSWARREETEGYCRERQFDFRHDEMNADEAFSRVKVRGQLLPLMKSFNNRIVETLSRTALLLSEDSAALADDASRLLELAFVSANKDETQKHLLDVSILSSASPAVRRRALREWIQKSRGNLRRVEMVHLLAVEKLIEGEKGGRTAELPGALSVVRKRGMLELRAKKRLKKNDSTTKIPKL
jgi:tRNA(Ile)-lysidine synthase